MYVDEIWKNIRLSHEGYISAAKHVTPCVERLYQDACWMRKVASGLFYEILEVSGTWTRKNVICTDLGARLVTRIDGCIEAMRGEEEMIRQGSTEFQGLESPWEHGHRCNYTAARDLLDVLASEVRGAFDAPEGLSRKYSHRTFEKAMRKLSIRFDNVLARLTGMVFENLAREVNQQVVVEVERQLSFNITFPFLGSTDDVHVTTCIEVACRNLNLERHGSDAKAITCSLFAPRYAESDETSLCLKPLWGHGNTHVYRFKDWDGNADDQQGDKILVVGALFTLFQDFKFDIQDAFKVSGKKGSITWLRRWLHHPKALLKFGDVMVDDGMRGKDFSSLVRNLLNKWAFYRKYFGALMPSLLEMLDAWAVEFDLRSMDAIQVAPAIHDKAGGDSTR